MAGWEVGAIWNVNRAANQLACVELWHVPSIAIPEFEVMTRQFTFASGIGLPGRVWSSGQPVWVPDVTKDPNFPRAAVAVKEGLHAGFCFYASLAKRCWVLSNASAARCVSPTIFPQMLASMAVSSGTHRAQKTEEELRNKEANPAHHRVHPVSSPNVVARDATCL
jgi:hypothetical protein